MSTLYEQLAESLEQRIRDGHLRPGERLPSVRQACAQAQVSAATVFQAYYLLESRGLIEARPRSGYYVCRPVQGQARPARPEQVRTESTPVAISELVFEVLNSTVTGRWYPWDRPSRPPSSFRWIGSRGRVRGPCGTWRPRP